MLVIFVCPFFSPAASQMIEAALRLTHIRLAVVAQQPLAELAPAMGSQLVAHWQVADVTNAEQLFLQALSLSPEARAELTDRLVASSAEAIDPGIEQAHFEEIRRRMAQLDSGEVEPVAGDVVMAKARAMLGQFGASDRVR